MSNKNRNFRPQHAPRPTKGALHNAAQEQHKLDETKGGLPGMPLGEKTEISKEDVAAVKEVLAAVAAGDPQAAAEAIVKNLTNDPAAGNEQGGVPQTPPEQPAAESPPPVKSRPRRLTSSSRKVR